MADTHSDPPYGYTAHMRGVSFDDARARVTDALKQEGFGILTEIDVQSTLKAKLDRPFRKYVILGACNPQLAHRALEVELGDVADDVLATGQGTAYSAGRLLPVPAMNRWLSAGYVWNVTFDLPASAVRGTNDATLLDSCTAPCRRGR